MNRRNSLLGIVLVIIGALMLALRYLFGGDFLTFGPDDFWPMIILMLGVGFEMAFFITMKAPGLLVPGGILTTYGILFFFEVATNWRFAEYTWPVYLIGIVVGLFQLFLFTGRHKGLLIAIGIIGGIAAACILIIMFRIIIGTVDIGLVIPIVLVLGGIVMLFGRGRSKASSW